MRFPSHEAFAMRISSLLGLAALGIAGTGEVAAQALPPAPTIRHMAGAAPVTALQADRTVLLVIDFQNEYFPGGRMVIPDGEAALRQTRRLRDFAGRHGIRVVHVRHVLPAGAPLFAEGSRAAAFHPGMQPGDGETVVRKDAVSVFAGTSAPVMDQVLRDARAETLIITGLQTHACVAGAARDAAARGYRVLVSSDATATRDLDTHGGGRIHRKALHAAALAEVEDTFGDVMDTDQVLALPVR